jgi:hypothetical protein
MGEGEDDERIGEEAETLEILILLAGRQEHRPTSYINSHGQNDLLAGRLHGPAASQSLPSAFRRIQ